MHETFFLRFVPEDHDDRRRIQNDRRQSPLSSYKSSSVSGGYFAIEAAPRATTNRRPRGTTTIARNGETERCQQITPQEPIKSTVIITPSDLATRRPAVPDTDRNEPAPEIPGITNHYILIFPEKRLTTPVSRHISIILEMW
jgi:hypothetical protein